MWNMTDETVHGLLEVRIIVAKYPVQIDRGKCPPSLNANTTGAERCSRMCSTRVGT